MVQDCIAARDKHLTTKNKFIYDYISNEFNINPYIFNINLIIYRLNHVCALNKKSAKYCQYMFKEFINKYATHKLKKYIELEQTYKNSNNTIKVVEEIINVKNKHLITKTKFINYYLSEQLNKEKYTYNITMMAINIGELARVNKQTLKSCQSAMVEFTKNFDNDRLLLFVEIAETHNDPYDLVDFVNDNMSSKRRR